MMTLYMYVLCGFGPYNICKFVGVESVLFQQMSAIFRNAMLGQNEQVPKWNRSKSSYAPQNSEKPNNIFHYFVLLLVPLKNLVRQ
jgi:hypothetical protein